MIYRFGSGLGGQFARVASSVATIAFTVGMVAYLVKGVGMFLATFLPFEPWVCSVTLVGIATLYTLASGFYGVVVTDILQAFIILGAVIAISVMAMSRVVDNATLVEMAEQVTKTKGWASSSLTWTTDMPPGEEYEIYKHLGFFALFFLFKNIFHGMATGDDPKYFGARSDREAGLLTILWQSLMMFRWPMMMGFAVLGIYLVDDFFPNQGVLTQAADIIKTHVGAIDKAEWGNVLARLIHQPESYPQIVEGLQEILGGNWHDKIYLLSFDGHVNPEGILPAVILNLIPTGLRGLLLVALIAASMSTFDSFVNRAMGYFTRDIYQAYFRPNADTRELMRATWVFGTAMIVVAVIMGFNAESINDIWSWIMTALVGGFIVPPFLRFYWWRFNGAGFALGTVAGLAGAFGLRIFGVSDPVDNFMWTAVAGLVGSIVGTFIAPPTDRAVLENFYKTTKPFGFWSPLKSCLNTEELAANRKEHRNDALALPFTLLWQVTLFLLPMQLIVKDFDAFWTTLPLFIVGLVGLYFFWYRNLPRDNKASS
jgi:Na+/proline symporter